MHRKLLLVMPSDIGGQNIEIETMKAVYCHSFYCTDSECSYLEFDNQTSFIEESFRNDKSRAAVLPGGRLISPHNAEFSKKYVIEDGLVYEWKPGTANEKRRTKKAKKNKMFQ